MLEAIPDSVAKEVTSRVKIPTIGIGAGPQCDGQVLVSYDVLGLFDEFVPPFAKQYAHLGEVVVSAAKTFADEVRRGVFPESSAARRAPVHISVVKGKTTGRQTTSKVLASNRSVAACGILSQAK